MIVLITYDVETIDPEGARRLRRVSKICKDYGIRVQKSVFECNVSPAQKNYIVDQIGRTIDVEKDSVRIYELGNNPSKIMHIGAHKPIDINKTLIF